MDLGSLLQMVLNNTGSESALVLVVIWMMVTARKEIGKDLKTLHECVDKTNTEVESVRSEQHVMSERLVRVETQVDTVLGTHPPEQALRQAPVRRRT